MSCIPALNRTERHKNETKKPGNNKQKWGGKGAGGGLLCLKGVGKMAARRRMVSINIRERGAGAVVVADQRPRTTGGGGSSKYDEYNTLKTDSIIVIFKILLPITSF